MSFVKYRVKEVAADFGITPKEVSEIIGKFGEKPKSNTQVLTDVELNCVFDYMTRNHQISSIEQVFATAAKKPEAKPAAPKAEAPKAEPVAPKAEKKVEPKVEKKPEPKVEKKAEPKPEKPKAPKAPQQPKAPKAVKEFAPAEPGSVEEKIETFLKGLLEHMGSQAVPHAWKENDNTYMVELVGDDLGYLIGRRGDTLDALQHLSNYTINRGIEGHIRINVDAEAYRQKREDSLRRYAVKKAQQVLKAHRRTTLEPMNAYERHVIHATLQDMDRITTYSVGTEPNRRVVIEYVR